MAKFTQDAIMASYVPIGTWEPVEEDNLSHTPDIQDIFFLFLRQT